MNDGRNSQRVLLLSLLLFFFWTLPVIGYEVTNLTQLTNGSIAESGCTFNANGTKIAYRNMHSPYFWANCDIWVMNTNGSGKTQITTDSRGEFEPRFAPDGRITYTKEFGSNDYDLWIVNGDGSSPHSLIGGSYRQTTCRWHPSGNKLVYCSEYMQDAAEIWTANPDGSGKVRLTNHTLDGYGQNNPIYSRSGNLIAYANYSTSSTPPHLWVMNANGSGKHQIVFGSAGQNPMFWWPDDSIIGYIQDGELCLHNLSTGTEELLLSVPGGNIGWCDLSLDGTKLVFDSPDGHIWIGDVVSGIPPEPNRKRVIIDMDPSFWLNPEFAFISCDPDDILALIYAAQSPYCQLEGITVGWGNMWDIFEPGNPLVVEDPLGGDPLLETQVPGIDFYFRKANEALGVLVDAHILDGIPPLKKGASFEETWRELGVDPANPAAVMDGLEPTEAVDFINKLVSENHGEITIIAQGTLTNLATAMFKYEGGAAAGGGPEEFMNDVGEIWIIGGAVEVEPLHFPCWPGNVPWTWFASEYNIWRDPNAAEYVFASVNNSPLKVHMVPLDATMDAPIPEGLWNTALLPYWLLRDQIAEYVYLPVLAWMNTLPPDPTIWLPSDMHPYDTIGVALALDSSLTEGFASSDYKIKVELENLPGKTVSANDLTDRGYVRVYKDFDTSEFKARFINRMGGKTIIETFSKGLGNFVSEGDVQIVDDGSGENNVAQLSEGSDAAISWSTNYPSYASAIEFDYDFTQQGDGDVLQIIIGEQMVWSVIGTNYQSNSLTSSGMIDISGYTVQATNIDFRLKSMGETNSQVLLDNITLVAGLPPDNLAATASAGGPYVAQATGWEGAWVFLDGRDSFDPDGDELTYEWDLDMAVDSGGDGDPNNDVDATEPTATRVFPIGQTDISLVVTDEYGVSSEPDVTMVTVSLIEVSIDIKPGSYPNSINMGSNGVIPVAFLTDEAFDASTIDPATVTLRGEDFSDGLVKLRGKKDAPVPMSNLTDVDDDGDLDLVVHLETEKLAEYPLDADCELGALTYDGFVVSGSDTIRIVPE